MIISAASDYRAAAQRILPPFLFHYIDGGAYAEHTLRRNVEDLSDVALRQRILRNMSDLSLETTLFNEKLAMPTALAPVGLCGMYARRGEVQAAGAADEKGIPFTLSTVSVCPIEEVARPLSARCGSSCTSCATAVLCAMRWSGRRRRAVQRWSLPSICRPPARAIAMLTPG
ncbi:L-lactate dehydrogenase [Klebsiella michiganensis]|uniref:L-lactate dehydrogenase n=1 Tax=Klebsiella michiganensis TaxID=1134687 RepID=A0A7H4PFI0_9ENTR|nr:L-lactate dehydrogenase [Klebsiella michiganensis]